MIPPRAVVIGVDPGPVPGIVVLGPGGSIEVVQCSAGVAPSIVGELVRAAGGPVLLAIESFVVSTRAGRSSSPAAGAATRDLIGALDYLATCGDRTAAICRRAADVKPWATDRRLDAAGLLDATAGMRHARDAARHALYAAVHDCGLPDPLSRRGHPARSPSRKVPRT